MKKYFAYTLVAMGCMVGSVQAANDVYFSGSVTNHTCDLVPDVPGSGGVTNLVDLGSVAPGTNGSPVGFALRPQDPTSPGCTALPPAGLADISWVGNLNYRGLQNSSGSSADTWAAFKTVNSEGAQKNLTYTSSTAQWKNSVITSDGAKFEAQLMGGTQPGTFVSVSAFVVAYQ